MGVSKILVSIPLLYLLLKIFLHFSSLWCTKLIIIDSITSLPFANSAGTMLVSFSSVLEIPALANEEISRLGKCLLCQHGNLWLNSKKLKNCAFWGVPVFPILERQTQMDPWNSLDSKSSHIFFVPGSVRPLSQKQNREPLRNDTRGWPQASLHTYMNATLHIWNQTLKLISINSQREKFNFCL